MINQDKLEQAVFDSMCYKAMTIGLERGAAAILIMDPHWRPDDGPILRPSVRIYGLGFVRPPEKAEGKLDTGSNYAALVVSNIFQMVADGIENSYRIPLPREGEFLYLGGTLLRFPEANVYIAFSGGNEDENLQLAELGSIKFSKMFTETIEKEVNNMIFGLKSTRD